MNTFYLAIDMHGGDLGLPSLVEATAQAIAKLPQEVHFILCGDKPTLEKQIQTKQLDHLLDSGRFCIEDALNTTNPEELSVTRFWRQHPNAPLVKALALQKEGRAQATLSAGDTGILFGSAFFMLGRQNRNIRPALAATLPTKNGRTALLLDVGANLICKPEHLVNFGELGVHYMQRLCPDRSPKVGLLNVGHEAHKGSELIQQTHELLSQQSFEYHGYVEGNHIIGGEVDVIICDGYTGNALLKMAESMFSFMQEHLSDTLSKNAHQKMDLFNSELYGSVPILGLKGSVFKAHGASSTNALTHAILTTVKTVYLTDVMS